MSAFTAREALDRMLLLCRDFVVAESQLTDDAIVEVFQNTSVCVVADEGTLSTAAAQSALVSFAALVLRMGFELRLAIPEVAVRGHQPPLRGEELRAALVELGGDLTPGTRVGVVEASAEDDLVFVLGNTPWSGRARDAWRLGWTRWSGCTSAIDRVVPADPTDFPVGALASAAIAAAEPFKHVLRCLPLRDGVLDQIALVREAHVRLGADDLYAEGCDLGCVDFVSNGALTQACLHALFRVPGIRGVFRTFEPETLDGTNLNRYALARRSHVDLPKASIAQAAAPPGVSILPVAIRFDETTLRDVMPLAPMVVVGTDNVPSRWLAQRARPRWLAIAATDHFLAMTSEHYAGVGCGQCLHDRDDGVVATIPTVSFVSYWGGLLLAARVLRHAAGDVIKPDEQVTMMWSLQLGSRFGQLHHAVAARGGCEVCGRLAA